VSDRVEVVVGVEETISRELRWWCRSSLEVDGGVEEVAEVKEAVCGSGGGGGVGEVAIAEKVGCEEERES
jgi:hypothetical protein